LQAFIDSSHIVLKIIAEISIDLMELIGALILVAAAFKALYDLYKKNPRVRLEFSNKIALALQFKLAGELIRTLIVHTWSEIGLIGAIMVLRAGVTLLIHWEIKHEEERIENEKARGELLWPEEEKRPGEVVNENRDMKE